ncbi:MAG: hypothetical protein K6F39_06455 [Lachnospiraceae bacterium]|nr:hypothetical protein [Lachnospiraceae bacterium]
MSGSKRPYHEWEIKHDLLNKKQIEGFQYWNYMRRDMFMSFNDEYAHVKPVFYKNMEDNRETLICKVKEALALWKHPMRTKSENIDVLFVCHPRRQEIDGKMVSIYTDYIADHFPDSATLQRVSKTEYPQDKIYSKNVIFNYRVELMSYIYRILVQKFQPARYRRIREQVENEMREPFRDLEENYDLHPKLKSFAERVTALYFFYKYRYPKYEKLLKKLKPKAIVEVVGGSVNTKIINEIAKNMQIPTVELQHGTGAVMNEFPKDIRIAQFTDWYFTFADFWKNVTDYPLEENHVFAGGFPYHDIMMDKYPRESWKHDKNTIVFLSSPKYGREMSELAVKLKKIAPELNIIYKFHPKEISGWKERYKELAEADDIRVIDETKTPLYSLFAESSIQVGVESTAVYEGMSFELDTYIWDIPQAEPMRILVENGFARHFSDEQDLAEFIKTGAGKKYDADMFWKSDSMENIVSKLKEIVD